MDGIWENSTSVVVATDGSSFATSAVDWASEEAASRHESLVIVTAYSGTDDAAKPDREEILRAAAERVHQRFPDLIVTSEAFAGDPRKALELYQEHASVVVIGSRGLGGVGSLLLGSVSFWATRHLTVPFAVVRPPDTERLSSTHRIAVGIGSEAGSEATLRAAFAMARRRSAPLTIANAAWDEHASGNTWTILSDAELEPHRHDAVTGLAEKVSTDYPDVTYSVLFARGRVDYFLASLGHSHDALVLGRKQSTLLDFIGLGTLASFVVEHGVGATLVVPVKKEER